MQVRKIIINALEYLKVCLNQNSDLSCCSKLPTLLGLSTETSLGTLWAKAGHSYCHCYYSIIHVSF